MVLPQQFVSSLFHLVKREQEKIILAVNAIHDKSVTNVSKRFQHILFFYLISNFDILLETATKFWS